MAGIGLNGHWGSAPHTSAMNGAAVVGREIVTNGRLTLLAIAGADPIPTFVESIIYRRAFEHSSHSAGLAPANSSAKDFQR